MLPLKEAHQKFINYLKEKDRSLATILAYGKDIDQLVQFFFQLEKNRTNDIKKEDIEAFMAKLQNEGYTLKSISRKTNSTKTFFRFLRINEFVTDNPAALISHPRFETPPPRILSQTEYRALRDVCRNDTRMAAVVEILLQTGIRIGELCQIRLEDLRFAEKKKAGELFIRPQHNHPERTIPLNSAVAARLKEYLESRPKTKENTLFVTKTGKPFLVRNIRSAMDRCFKIAGIKDAKVNDLRHTFIAHHLMKGTSLIILSKIAGHKRLATTEKYLKHIQSAYKNTFKLEEL
ncbi:hypothetical protein CO015_04640 [candidate division WWE3 bacterium CG_4_8_14_3_um_filter_42_11]|uniref:Tyrosine recombinase XerC n=3 Tax=Katanobacteria TaxID=422282 RepID=A0A2M7TBA3_UNCKA|nr:MAG: hypothetical protein AUJ38_02785 [bacterium CG1_02_42_9]PIZ42332.1 MAG: hypothetical protein COY34_03010 [candidate division WWE3 bacterium CG_4_10_14_0_2_um_filter_42_8]PJA38174.1 MAG: hypothetical protein CO181_01040 [candidate division WWE3 bacterium CG_4_9_14_3_um_filter_43_9]PJC68277.1 MAG: hypothetical protein CO015_04640 [candidate division WWE3 bacterium CG_4_8_14_3_um_filter_42_11]